MVNCFCLYTYHCIKYFFNGFLMVADHCSNEGMVTIFYYKCNDQRMFIVVGIWLWGSVSCESGYWKFEKWKVKWKSDSLFLRSEKWNENLIQSFREVKSEKKREISREFSRNLILSFRELKSEMKMPRDWDREVKFLENSREFLENRENS